MWARSLCAVIALTLSFAACDQGGAMFPACRTGNAGIVEISWTVRGAAATAVSCNGIDHLELDISPQLCEGASIEPIPCIDGAKWRYDGLPQGPAQLALIAIDTMGNPTLQGTTAVDLEAGVPSSPTPIDLR